MFNLKASLRKVTPPKVTISYTTWPWLEAEILEYFFSLPIRQDMGVQRSFA